MVLNVANLLLYFVLDCWLHFVINNSDQRIASRDEVRKYLQYVAGSGQKQLGEWLFFWWGRTFFLSSTSKPPRTLYEPHKKRINVLFLPYLSVA